MSEVPVTANGMQLRSKRSHDVGGPDRKRPRRRTDEVTSEKEAKSQQKEVKARQRKKNLQDVAHVEQLARNADKENSALDYPSQPRRTKSMRPVAVQKASKHAASGGPDSGDEAEHERERQRQVRREKKREVRTFVDAEQLGIDGSAPARIKRKAEQSIVTERNAKKNKRADKACGGLRPDWSLNATSSTPVGSVQHQPIDQEPIGGISDDDGNMVERGALGFKPLAKVNLTPVVPPPQISSTRKAFTIKKKNISIKDVPEGLQSEFSETYIPYAIRHVGAQKPWYLPNITDVEAAWTRVFTSNAQPTLEHLVVGEKMINNHLSAIRNKMKEAAVKALDTHLKDEGKITIEDRREYVEWLSGEGDFHENAPFFFKVVENGKTSGAFQSYLISATFSIHLHAISRIPAVYGKGDQQAGALVMAIQAVKRALFYYRNGIKEDPNPRDPTSHFSQANWDDRKDTIINDDGSTSQVLIPTSTYLTALVDQLTKKQWKKIVSAALEFTKIKPLPPPTQEPDRRFVNEKPRLIDDDDDINDQTSDETDSGELTDYESHHSADSDYWKTESISDQERSKFDRAILDRERECAEIRQRYLGGANQLFETDDNIIIATNMQRTGSVTESDPDMPASTQQALYSEDVCEDSEIEYY